MGMRRQVKMIHDPANTLAAASPSDTKLRGLLGGMSVFTMIMTVPQVWAIWVGQQAAGVSILSWSAYLVSALLWLWFGIRKHDRNIYLPCLGWIALDGAVIRELWFTDSSGRRFSTSRRNVTRDAAAMDIVPGVLL
jgi:uncharacterized protein with PQ loop repeat